MFYSHKKLFQNFLIASVFSTVSVHAQNLRVMSYNVENLFDTVDSPDTADEEFTPSGKQRWTEKVLSDKIKNLGEVIASSGAEVVGLEEIENQEVLNRLVNEGLRGQGFVAAYAGPSDDARGIRCAIISKFPILSVKSHRVWDDSWMERGAVKKTRDVLEAKVRVTKGKAQQDITFLVNHWPSRGGAPAFRDRVRLEAAQKTKSVIENIVSQDPSALVIAVGDFNDELNDRSITNGLKPLHNLSDFIAAEAGSVFALDSDFDGLPKEQTGTFFYGKERRWNSLDHMFMAVGDDLLKGRAASFNYKSKSIQVFRSRFVKSGRFPVGCEVGMRQDNSCPNGASDHFPLIADFFAR